MTYLTSNIEQPEPADEELKELRLGNLDTQEARRRAIEEVAELLNRIVRKLREDVQV